MLYEIVGGRVPFEGHTSSDVIASILEKKPISLARYAPDVSQELEWIVEKTLAKGPRGAVSDNQRASDRLKKS